MKPKPIRLFSRVAMMLLMMMLTTMTAWAQSIISGGYVKVNINGSGTVTVTHGSVTENFSTSGTSSYFTGDYTINFVPSSGYEVNKVTLKGLWISTTGDKEINVDRNGGSYTSQAIAGTEEYTVFFEKPGEPGADIFYTLTSSVYPMTFSVGGATVSTAKEGDRVDVTLSEPVANGRWELLSSEVGLFTKDDATHFHFTMPGRNVTVQATLIVENNMEYTITDNSTHGHVNVGALNGNDWDIETAMLTVEPDAGYEYEDGSLSATNLGTGEAITLTALGNGRWAFTMPKNNIAVSATFTPDPTHFADNGDGSYTIKTTAGWGVFCDALQDNDTYNRFIGKTVKLGADITVTRMAGSSSHDFCGTFDGQEHTLTFNYTTDENDAAPFRYVEDGCVIKDLRVCGTIETSAKFAAGLIAHQYGNVTIRNCRSSVTIKSSVSSENGDGTHGGFVAENHSTADITFEGCLFDGKLLTTSSTATTRCGGFVGWRSNNEGAVITVTNSLYAPTALEVGEMWVSSTESATFVRNGIASDITNSYYTSDFNDGSSFTGQGKAACPATAAPIGDATHDVYTVSGITAYANGLTCGETFYYGGGENVSVSYVNESGYTVSHNCTALDPSHMPTKDLSGWYYVADDITYTDKITPGADVTFILADDKTMNIGTSESPRDGYCIEGGTKDLTIYGQTNQSGTLNAYNDNSKAAAVKVSDYTQHGGNVNIDAKKGDALYPTFGNLTLTRGTLTANAASHAIFLNSGYTATVSGGTLTATVSGTFSAINGPLALSGTATVKVTGSISRDVTIAAGQVFTDGNGHYYTGTLSADEKTAIDGQTLTRLTALQLADAGDNSAAIDKCNGIAFPVTLQGRTLYKDGNWNTLCLPFNLGNSSAEEGHHFDGTPLADATVMELDGTTSGFDASSGTLTLNFNTANSISAGKPYIIKWASADDLVNPLFNGVTINATNSPVTSQDGKVQFRGIYAPAMIYSADHDNLFLGIGKNNQNEDVSMLFWPNTTDYTLGAFRAYFHVDLTETNGVRDIVLNFEDGTQTTGIIGHTEITEITEKADAWYTLDGRKLEGKPTKKGLYMYKGRKVVIK